MIHPKKLTIYSNPYTWLTILSIAVILSILIFSNVFRIGGGNDTFVTVSLIAAFIGGFLSLISPCSAAMLPVFFAYSFKEKRELVKMTFVFYLGLATLFVPLGFSTSFITNAFFKNQILFFNVAGTIFILLGIMIFFGISWQWLPKRFRSQNLSEGKKSIGTIYLMGLLFSFATGTCSAPIIGGILTLASTSSNSITAVVLLLTYALGLVMPMFIMAWFFDKYNFSNSKLVRGKSFDMTLLGKRIHIHSTNIITSLLFVGIGIIFIYSRGTNLFVQSFTDTGLIDFYYNVNAYLLRVTGDIPSIVYFGIFAAIALMYYFRRNKKKIKN